MIKEIKDQFHDGILAAAAERYGTTPEALKPLGGFESYVYEYEQAGQPRILKITHTLRRSENYIRGELEWLNYLADHGVSVARALPSEAGRWVESIPAANGSHFLVIAYVKAPGQWVTKEIWNAELFATWGRLIGRMHALTKDYVLSDPAFKRQEWHEEDQLNVRKYLPEHEADVIRYADELMARIGRLPQDRDSYGLIHTDLHMGNFFWQDGELTAFDFDDIGYNWFVNDIALCLFYTRFSKAVRELEDQNAFAAHFLEHFLRGYREENALDPSWLPHGREFLLLRNLLLFVIVYQSYDTAAFTDEQRAELDEHRRMVLEEIPYFEIDWASFGRFLKA